MTTAPAIQSHPASVDAYIRHGWSLVPIPYGTKGPSHEGWNIKESALRSQSDLPPGYGIGLAHAYSGTMALDVDQWDRADAALQQHGISLNDLYSAPDAVIVDSGNPGHGKLLYAMPFGVALPSKKLTNTIDGKRRAYLEFRCATADGLTMQDVLPPSIHPGTGQPYRWAGLGHWERLPIIPAALLTWWQSMIDADKARTIETDTTVNTSWDEIRSAVNKIDPDLPRDEWVGVGMALHWAGVQTDKIDDALWIWNDWSAKGVKYPGERAILAQWRSFRTDKSHAVRLGTLFHLARQFGWHRPIPDVSELFMQPATEADPQSIHHPMDMIKSMRPTPPEMRMDLWPDVLFQRSMEVSESVGCDPVVPLFAGIAAVCGVVDARIRLELMPGFRVPPVLWLMTIGDPADKKSPGSRPMLAPLRGIEADDRPRYSKALLDWEGREAAYSAAKKSFLEWSASPDALLDVASAPTVPDMPPAPVPLKITVSDITSQKLVRQAADRPRGLLCHLDEMASWVRKMVDRSSGEDRSAWVVSYESEAYEMDRVGAGSIHADNLAVSIYGNIQPQVYRQNLAALSADGMLQRFIPAVLRADKTRLGHPVPEYMSSAAAWENTLRMVYALPEQTYTLTPEAYGVFRAFQQWYEEAKRDERIIESNVEYMTAFGKLEGLAGRLALIVHIIESPFSPTVSSDVMERVVDLVRGYVIPAFRYALGEIGGSMDYDLDQWVTEHIIHISADQETVGLSDLKRSARRKIEDKTDWQRTTALLESMALLERSGWVAQIENDLAKSRVTWAINPSISSVFAEYRNTVLVAKQRHVDYIYRHAYNKGYDRKMVKGYDPETME